MSGMDIPTTLCRDALFNVLQPFFPRDHVWRAGYDGIFSKYWLVLVPEKTPKKPSCWPLTSRTEATVFFSQFSPLNDPRVACNVAQVVRALLKLQRSGNVLKAQEFENVLLNARIRTTIHDMKETTCNGIYKRCTRLENMFDKVFTFLRESNQLPPTGESAELLSHFNDWMNLCQRVVSESDPAKFNEMCQEVKEKAPEFECFYDKYLLKEKGFRQKNGPK